MRFRHLKIVHAQLKNWGGEKFVQIPNLELGESVYVNSSPRFSLTLLLSDRHKQVDLIQIVMQRTFAKKSRCFRTPPHFETKIGPHPRKIQVLSSFPYCSHFSDVCPLTLTFFTHNFPLFLISHGHQCNVPFLDSIYNSDVSKDIIKLSIYFTCLYLSIGDP